MLRKRYPSLKQAVHLFCALGIALLLFPLPAAASEPFVGEIRMFAGNFAPRGWAFCEGQLLSIPTNDALFSLLGTTYGGDGRTTFGLPDLRGRIPIHAGTGPGLTQRRLGQKSGLEKVSLNATQIPKHTNTAVAKADALEGNTPGPENALWAKSASGHPGYIAPESCSQDQETTLLSETTAIGNSQGHNNMPPFLGIRYIIALFGIYPSRN